jgi:hypothetical protein
MGRPSGPYSNRTSKEHERTLILEEAAITRRFYVQEKSKGRLKKNKDHLVKKIFYEDGSSSEGE